MRSLAAMKKSNAMRNRWNGLLDTLADLEGTVLERNAPKHILPPVPSGRLTVDFYLFDIMQRPASDATASNSSHSIHDSSVNEYASPVCAEWASEPQALVEECTLIQHAEPLPRTIDRERLPRTLQKRSPQKGAAEKF